MFFELYNFFAGTPESAEEAIEAAEEGKTRVR
jgi:hypothetical protein